MNVEHCNDTKLLKTYAKTLEVEIRVLNRRLIELRKELAHLRGDQQLHLQMEVQILQERIDRQNQELFGDSSERKKTEEDEETQEKPDEKKKKKKPGHGPRSQLSLPIETKVHILDEADLTCPDCGAQLPEWKDRFEESEEIDVVERIYKVVRHQRQKYRCGCGHIESALGPLRLIPGGRYSLNIAIDVAVSKYADHLPLHRQVQQAERLGLVVTSQTLWDQINALAEVVKPSYDALILHVLNAAVIGADETTWRLLNSEKSKKKWWVWAATGNGAVFYQLMPTRRTEAAQELLRGYSGIVMADGYQAYQSLADSSGGGRDGPGFTLVQCWAHARRKFVKAEPHYPKAAEGIALIGQLYGVEKEVNRAQVDSHEERAALRLRLRKEKSAEILKCLKKWLYAQQLEERPLPKSSYAKALSYVLDRWNALTRFVEDPRIPLDNNETERSMRSPVLGRKNHYGSKSKRGTEVAAILYSLVESAKLHGVNPVTYLREAAQRALADPKATLLPHELADIDSF